MASSSISRQRGRPPVRGSANPPAAPPGAKTGTERVTPLVYRPDGDNSVVLASKAGAQAHPHGCLNLTANPDTTIEVGSRAIDVTATEVTGEGRNRKWEAQEREAQQFADYKASIDQTIPVLAVSRR